MSASIRAFASGAARQAIPALFSRATPDLYRSNAFRLTGMTVETAPRELARFGERVALQERIGAASPMIGGALPVVPAPTSRELRDALQRLDDPDQRLLDEFFWFWPMQAGSSTNDVALQALASGDLEKAKRLWLDVALRGFGANGSKPATARPPEVSVERVGIGAVLHNLAVLAHLTALNNDAAHLAASDVAVNAREEYEWRTVYQRWDALLSNDGAWNYLVNRIRVLDDPRLTPEYSRQLRRGLPALLLTVQGALVRRAAERGAGARASLHVGIIERSGFKPAIIADCFRCLIEPDVARLRTMRDTAVASAKRDPKQGAGLGRQLLEQAQPVLERISACLPAPHGIRDEMYDQVAETALSCAVRFGNATEDWKTVVSLTEAIVQVAAGQTLRERIEQNVKQARENLEASQCWFCHDQLADANAALPVPMHGGVEREYKFLQGTQVRWRQHTVPVPRCKHCEEMHARVDRVTGRGRIFGAVVGFTGCLGVVDENAFVALLILAGCVMLGGFIAKRAALASTPSNVRPASAAHYFPLVVALQRAGWQFGAKPSNVS